MGFLKPAVPWIIKGGAMLGGALLGRKAQSSAQKRSPEELVSLQNAQNIGSNLFTTGQSVAQTGTGAVNPALSYYSALLGGDRAKMAQATAGPKNAIVDQYRGAEKGIERSGLRGAGRMQAEAELGRDKAAKVAGLTTGVQPMAAAALGNLGTDMIGQGSTMMGNAGSIYRALLGEAALNRYYAREEGEKAGKSVGGFLFDALGGLFGGGGGGGGGVPGLPGGSRGPF